MKELLQQLVKDIIKSHKNALSVYLQGSALKGELCNFGDIDVTIICPKDIPTPPFQIKKIKYNGKNILISYSFRELKNVVSSAKRMSPSDYAREIVGLSSATLLYDKRKYFPKILATFKKNELKEKMQKNIPLWTNILIDSYYKAMRSWQRKDTKGFLDAGRHVADKSLKILSAMNPIIIDKTLLVHPKSIRNKPKGFEKDFDKVVGYIPVKEAERYKAMLRLFNTTMKLGMGHSSGKRGRLHVERP